ncbi:MAG: hypothetical protein MUC28_01910, partial [Planctomycetes bacterium]|nr:hypothetical protein [Planctomycetota bacterium]
MKRHICSAVVLLTLLATSTVFAEDAKVKIISTIPAVTSKRIGWDINVSVIQIEDQENGVVCYGLVPTSEIGRNTDGG